MMLVLLYNIIQLYKIQSSQKYCRGPLLNPPYLFMLQLVMYTTQASILQMHTGTVLHTCYTLRFQVQNYKSTDSDLTLKRTLRSVKIILVLIRNVVLV